MSKKRKKKTPTVEKRIPCLPLRLHSTYDSPKTPPSIHQWLNQLNFDLAFTARKDKLAFKILKKCKAGMPTTNKEVYIFRKINYTVLFLQLNDYVFRKANENNLITCRNAFTVSLNKDGVINIFYYDMEELKQSDGRICYSSYLKPTCKQMRVAFSMHAIEHCIFGSHKTRAEASESISRGAINGKSDTGYYDAYAIIGMKSEYELLSYKGQEFLRVYDGRILNGEDTTLLMGYCPVVRDCAKNLMVASTFLGVGMDGTPEADFIRETKDRSLIQKLDDITIYKILQDNELSSLLVKRFSLIDNSKQLHVVHL